MKLGRHPLTLAQSSGASYSRFLTGAGWSSLAARRAHNPKVVGSNPASATNVRSDKFSKGQQRVFGCCLERTEALVFLDSFSGRFNETGVDSQKK